MRLGGFWEDGLKLLKINNFFRGTVVSAAIWGGNFNNEVNAGVFALNLNNPPSNVNNNIGFRACKVN